MSEIELVAEELTQEDNNINVEMTDGEIWFVKNFISKCNPKKIVEIGISAGGNTVNLLKWKDKDTQLFSIDLSEEWYRDSTKLSGFMADELPEKNNWKIYRGYDYIDVYEEIGNDIDFIIIDTVHTMPGEILTFIAALPQLKDGCVVVLHDIHLNMKKFSNSEFDRYANASYCTGLLFSVVSSDNKWTMKSNPMANIGAFTIDDSTRNNIKDVFHTLCAAWHKYPAMIDMEAYSNFIKKNYPQEHHELFKTCLELHSNFFDNKKLNKEKEKDLKKENKKLIKENQKLSKKNKELNNENKKLKKEKDTIANELNAIKKTTSWNMTKPLRSLKSKFK